MSQVDIVYLDTYRRRRDARFRCALALHTREPDRLSVLDQLWKATSLVGGDRAGVIWVDEYGPGLAHPHTVLDLGADRPRRIFSPVPLRSAWETRVPGLLDLPQAEGTWAKVCGGVSSACVVAIGSDGPRSWFLVVDSLTPRPALSEDVTGELMFLAGEIASIVLHKDLMVGVDLPGRIGSGVTQPNSEDNAFAGWPILKDLEDGDQSEEASLRIRNRFLVTRVVRGMVEDDLVVDRDSLSYQIENVLRELGAEPLKGPEGESWERVLKAAASGDPLELVSGVLEWGRFVDGLGHTNGALEILGMAFDLAKAVGSPEAATDAARFQGKVLRALAEWDRALAWYEIARTVAAETEGPRKMAVVLDGMANTYRDRGNFPKARALLQEVLVLGEDGGDRYASAIAHHDLMTVEKLGGDLVSAIRHGWLAVQSYDSDDGRYKALFDLAGVLQETGELSSAANAYSIVVQQVATFEHRVLGLDALAYIAALQGDSRAHEGFRKQMDLEGWENLPAVYRGQVLYYRGMSNRALGRWEESNRWLSEALAHAERHDLSKLIFDAESELAKAEPSQDAIVADLEYAPEPFGQEIGEVRQGLRELRETLAGSVSGS